MTKYKIKRLSDGLFSEGGCASSYYHTIPFSESGKLFSLRGLQIHLGWIKREFELGTKFTYDKDKYVICAYEMVLTAEIEMDEI